MVWGAGGDGRSQWQSSLASGEGSVRRMGMGQEAGERQTWSLWAGLQLEWADMGWREAMVYPKTRRHSRLDGFGHRADLVDL